MLIVEIILVILGLSALVVIIRNPREILIDLPLGFFKMTWSKMKLMLYLFFVLPFQLFFFLLYFIFKLKVYDPSLWRRLSPSKKDLFADYIDFDV